MSWNRKLWGVEFTSPGSAPLLIGTLWMRECDDRKHYPGEPTRPILFTTRKAAREWCRERTATTQAHGDCREFWAFRAVRVRETVGRV